MNRNYSTPNVSAQWAAVRNTDMIVAVAIHAIADSTRSPDTIWADPTSAEFDHVRMAVEEYVEHGDYAVEYEYNWGDYRLAINT